MYAIWNRTRVLYDKGQFYLLSTSTGFTTQRKGKTTTTAKGFKFSGLVRVVADVPDKVPSAPITQNQTTCFTGLT